MRKFIAITFVFSLFNSLGQSTPINDPMWGTPVFSDEFNLSHLDYTKWDTTGDWRRGSCYNFYDNACVEHDLFAYRTGPLSAHNNFLFNTTGVTSTGVLNLIVKSDPITVYGLSSSCPTNACNSRSFNYTMPLMIKSVSDFKYGFFEIRCKLPDLATGETNMGIGAAFWLLDCNPNNCPPNNPPYSNCYGEIDVLEFQNGSKDPMLTQQDQLYTLCSHYRSCSSTCGDESRSLVPYPANRFGKVTFPGNTYRKFAAAWYPDKIEFYMDDNLISSVNNNQNNMRALKILLDLNVQTGGENFDTDASDGFATKVPYSYDIDYIKVYQFDYSDCMNLVSFFPASFASPGNKIKYDIGVGGIGETYVVPAASSISLKASNTITMEEGFEVGANALFIADIVQCPN